MGRQRVGSADHLRISTGKGADLWEEGIRRYCKHSHLKYLGMLAEHDPGYQHTFWSEEKELHARQFAANLLKESCEMRLE